MQAIFPIPEPAHVTALILAGGKARRLSGVDKGLIPLGKRHLIEYVIERLRPQVGTILINANRHPEPYRQFGYPVIADSLPDFAGPLAGMLAGLQSLEGDWLLTVPCDNPWLPADLLAKLAQGAANQACPLAVAQGAGRLQPVYALLHRSLTDSLHDALGRGQNKVEDWVNRQTHCVVDFVDARAFENINTPQQLAEAKTKLC